MIIINIRKNSKMLLDHQTKSQQISNRAPSAQNLDSMSMTPSAPINRIASSRILGTSPLLGRSDSNGGLLANNSSSNLLDKDDQENIIEENKPLLTNSKLSNFPSTGTLGQYNTLARNPSLRVFALQKSNSQPKLTNFSSGTPESVSEEPKVPPDSFSFLMFGSNIKYSTLTQSDIDEYIQFLHSQSRTALYYIAVLTLNWIVWITARLAWEFSECQASDNTSIVIFVVLSVFEQCSGPRMSSILLSIIFGISEDTVSPSTLSDMLKDVTSLRYFAMFCSDKIQSNELQHMELESLIFFWFDMYELNELINEEAEQGEDVNTEKYQGERKRKISAKLQQICDFYFSETSPFKIGSDILSNKEKNHIRTCVIRYSKGYLEEEEESSEESEYSSQSEEVESDQASSIIDDEGKIGKEDQHIIHILRHPLKSALRKMNDLSQEFKESQTFDELNNVLRMKAFSRRRSLFKDIFTKIARIFIGCGSIFQVWFFRR